MAELPKRFVAFRTAHKAVYDAYEALGDACGHAGPLAGKEQALVKLALAIGARMEGAVHSHVRRAREAGASAEEIRHVALLATPTIGFPNMMAALSWVDDVLGT